ncbi:MAG: helicase-related protein [Acidobacteriota bacterium]
MLVFLPGKGEIASVARALAGRSGLDVLPLHGGLSLDEQTRIFRPSTRRKVILATNVAETSLTVPGVGVVIDSGLVRRTRYARDRGYLTLVPIALDSADQRSGRAGRTAAGVAFRLWAEAAHLDARTPPEIHRESLVPLVLATAVHGADPQAIPWLDPPKAHAIDTAENELRALGALDGTTLTERGKRLFGLPLDAALGRWLIEAEARERDDPNAAGLLADMVDLVAALSTGRPPVARPTTPPGEEPTAETVCDAVAMLRAVRGDGSEATGRSMREARSARRRLRRLVELDDATAPSVDDPIDRRRLAETLLAADPRLAHIARRRGRRTGWSNGGTELEVGREAGLRQLDETVEAVTDAMLVLQAIGLGTAREARLVASRVMPIPSSWLAEAGLGRDRLATLAVREGTDGPEVVASIERVFAKRVLASRDDVPRGALARDAVAELYLRGTLYGAAERDRNREAFDALRLAYRLANAPDAAPWLAEVAMLVADELPAFEDWLRARVDRLGVDSGRDIALLDASDFRAPELPAHARAELDRGWPRRLKIDGVGYRVDYDLERSIVNLHIFSGKPQKLPGRFFLPRFPGFRVQVEHKGAMRAVD